MNTIQINPADNVIVALSPLAKGTAVAVPGVGEVVAAEDIPQGGCALDCRRRGRH